LDPVTFVLAKIPVFVRWQKVLTVIVHVSQVWSILQSTVSDLLTPPGAFMNIVFLKLAEYTKKTCP
jgi:hypothetical protein